MSTFRRSSLLLLAAVAVCGSVHAQQPERTARTLAIEAIEIMAAHPFEETYLQKAGDLLTRAQKIDANEPYVWAAAARLVERDGYRSGPPSKASSYDDEAIAAATKLAEKSVQLGPDLAETNATLADLYMIGGKFPEAKHHLYVAHKAEPDAWRPWFIQAEWYWYQGDAANCESALAGAESRAKTTVQKRAALSLRETIAASRGNRAEQERLLKAVIALEPGNAWWHGNYALFLRNMGRYDEAIAEYEKAIAIAPYPLAVSQLNETKALRDHSPKSGRQ